MIPERFIGAVCERLGTNKPVRRALSPWGRLHIDRQLPFLCVYRRPAGRPDRGTDRLIVGEASYLKVSTSDEREGLGANLVEGIVRTLSREFGSFLLLEIWTPFEAAASGEGDTESSKADFTVFLPECGEPGSAIEVLRQSLEETRVLSEEPTVRTVRRGLVSPPGMRPLLSADSAREMNCHLIGLEILPFFRSGDGETLFSQIHRRLQRELALALKRTFYRFAMDHTTHQPKHFHCLGRHAVVKAVWEADRRLANIINRIDLMLLVTPLNVEAAWTEFKAHGCERNPVFRYRPLGMGPAELKRRLFQVPVHRIEDPTLAHLYEEKRIETDRKISMLQDRETRNFLYGSLQVYGDCEARLYDLANEILRRLVRTPNPGPPSRILDAEELRRAAVAEIEFYHQAEPTFSPTVRVRADIPGVMISRGKLLIGTSTRVPENRLPALLQHEIGIHLLIHHNGKTQPLKILRYGLPGHEETQEGLAIFAEYLVGGLNPSRLRILAGRTVAVHHLVEGACFIDLFRILHRNHGFDRRTAFRIAMRAFRGGGLTKDVLYLRGALGLIDYLRTGGDLDILFLGRTHTRHAPIIQELRWREILKRPSLLPRCLEAPQAAEKMEGIRRGRGILDILEEA